jgi:uncharacterized protein (TIRG00374 family)
MTLSMPNGKPFKISLKKLFFPLLLVIVVIIILFKFSELREIGQLFAQAKWYWLVAAFAAQCLNFSLQAGVYRSTFKIVKIPYFPFFKFIKVGITVLFLTFTIPSFGFAGYLWFLKLLRRQGIKEGKALLSIVIELICYYAAFFFLLILSSVYLFFKLGNVGYTQIIAVASFAFIICFFLFAVYFFIGKKERAHKRVVWLAEKIDKGEDGIRQEDRIKELLADFYEDLAWLKVNKRKVLRPATMQLLKFLSDGLTIFLLFLAFGSVVPIGLGVVAFAFGRLFGLISFIPGGLGTFDAAMVLIFNSLGVSLELSLSVMLLYRLFSFWLYFPLGLVFYKQLDKEIAK